MVLACAVLILAILILFGSKGGMLIPLAFLLGAVMSAVTGIMELAKIKGDRLHLLDFRGADGRGTDIQYHLDVVL